MIVNLVFSILGFWSDNFVLFAPFPHHSLLLHFYTVLVHDFDFVIVNFPFLDGDVPRRASYGVYISQLIRFARVCNHVTDFNARNKCLTAKLLQQGYRYYKLRKTFSTFYRRHYELISKYNVGLKTLLGEGLSEPAFFSVQKHHYTLQAYRLYLECYATVCMLNF